MASVFEHLHFDFFCLFFCLEICEKANVLICPQGVVFGTFSPYSKRLNTNI